VSLVLTIMAAVVGYYLWLFFGTAFIFPTDKSLFTVLLVSPLGILLLAAALSAINREDSIP